jgi:pentatricopeptide repeat protein
VQEGNGVHAERIVYQLLQDYQKQQQLTKNKTTPLDSRIFSLVIQAWKNNSDNTSSAAAFRAHKMLQQMVALADQGILRAPPTLEDYHTVLKCWKHQSSFNHRVQLVQSIVDQTLQLLLDLKKQTDLEPSETTYELVLSVLANGGHVDMVQQLLEEVRNNKNNGLIPSVEMYNCLLLAWANSSQPDAPEQAQAILRRMQQGQQQPDEERMPKPDGTSYNIVLGCWSSSSDPNNKERAADQAEALLRQMRAESRDDVRMTSQSYKYVISALAKVGEGKRAEAWLTQLVKDYNHQFDAELKPDVEPFQSVLRAYSLSHHPDAALRAESVLTHMRELYQSEHLDTQPNVWSYNIVMRCWARSKSSPEAYQRAKAVLDDMPTHGIQPDTTSINTVLNACASSRNGNASQAQELLLEFYQRYVEDPLRNPQPDVISFTTVLKALVKSKSPEAPDRAEELLYKLQELYESGWEQCRPDAVAFATVIQCWGKSKRQNAPEKAESLLREMLRLAEEEGQADMAPDTVCWNSAINAWALAGNGEQAEALFTEMLANYIDDKQQSAKAAPTIITFTAVLSAWAKTRHSAQAVERAELLLRRMEQLYQSGALIDIKPNVVTYSIVLDCLAYAKRTSAAERAESILRKMKASDDKDVQPNVVSYNSVIKAWSFTRRDPQAVPRVTALLKELLDQAEAGNPKMRPNANTFGGVLKTLADSHVPDKEKRAQVVVNLMKKYGIEMPDWVRNQLEKCRGNGPRHRGEKKLEVPQVPDLKYS